MPLAPNHSDTRPARGDDRPELLVQARYVALVADLVHRLHRNHCGVRRTQSLGPIRSLEVRLDPLCDRESLEPVTAETQHVVREIQECVTRQVRATFEDALREEPWTRTQFENARPRWKRADEFGKTNAHWQPPGLIQLARRDPIADVLGVKEIDTRRNVGVWIGVVNEH